VSEKIAAGAHAIYSNPRLKPPPVNPVHGWFYLARGDAMRLL
jgi:hypothetical protein